MRRLILLGSVVVALAGLAGRASANGRPAGVDSIKFRQGHPADIAAGLTFGLVLSHDSGATWQWMCEKAVGYSGLFDPDYSYSQSGALFATTFGGFTVNRDGCTFDSTPPGTTFVSRDELGPDHALYIGAADVADAKIYKSTDDGVTFPTSASPGLANDWWESIAIAPSDPSRVYLSGYRFVTQCNAASSNAGTACTMAGSGAECPGGTCENTKAFLLFKSVDGAANFTPLPTTDIMTSPNSSIDIVGISPTDPAVVYAIATVTNGTIGDSLYKSTNSGATWTKILSKLDTLHFLARANGTCMIATQTLGAAVSTNCDATWTDLTSPPHINCLAENSLGEVWACTQNFGQMGGILSDGFGIMKSSDLATWTGVLKFQDITAPVACGTTTTQYTECQLNTWCSLKSQLGITSTAIDCTPPAEATIPVSPPKAGCCDAGQGAGTAALVFGALVMLVLGRSRRPRRSAR